MIAEIVQTNIHGHIFPFPYASINLKELILLFFFPEVRGKFVVKHMSFLGWGKTNEEVTDRPVTRSGQLTEEARQLATERAAEKKKKREEKRNKPKLEDLSPSGTEESGESSAEEYQNTSETNMAPYDQDDGMDGEGATKNVFNIRLEYDMKKIKLWFQVLENKMQFAQIRPQWTKLQVLTTVLPANLLGHIESFAALPQASAGATCYYQAKLRLIDIYGEKPHESYDKATRLVLATTPSELARQITDLICDHKQKPLENCCCAMTVMGIWLKQLSNPVRQAIANRQLGEGQLEETLKIADAVHRLVAPNEGIQLVATVATAASDLDEIAPALDPVAALRQSRGRGGTNRSRYYRGGRGYRGRGNYNSQQYRQQGGTTPQNKASTTSWGPKHADNPPQNACRQHWKFGKQAYYCRGTESSPCPWKEYCTPPGNG